MGKVYITNENGAQNELSELEARELVRQGLISKRARYWKSGMSGSRPVSELLEDPALDAPEEPGESPGWVERAISKLKEWFGNFRKGG
jgi:hypothetical protein